MVRHSDIIGVGVVFGHSIDAVAQTERPLTMFDLFAPSHPSKASAARNKKSQRGLSKSDSAIFVKVGEPFEVTPSKTTAAKAPGMLEPPVPRQKPGLGSAAEIALAKEKDRLERLSAGLQKQQNAQKAEAYRLAMVSKQQKQEREHLLKQRRELEQLRKSLASTQLNDPVGPSGLHPSGDQPNSIDERPPIGFQVPTFNGPEKRHPTRTARADPATPVSNSGSVDLGSPNCRKAKALIEGYAFSNVQPKACEGKSYLFLATRDKSSFTIRVNPQTWELSEVAKVAPKNI